MFDPYGSPIKQGAVEIIPAVLAKNFKEVTAQVGRVHGATKRIQIDVVDGIYARTGGLFSRATWPYKDGGNFATIIKEERGLPFWDDISYEFDLMIKKPAERVMDYVHAGASHIIVHARAEDAVDAVQKIVDLRGDTGAFEVKVGVALTCDAQPDELEKFEAQFDYVQVMGIATIGRQKQPFDMRALHLVERLHARYPQLYIQVDGGVNAGTIPQLVKAGVHALVAGSAVFKEKDAAAAYKKLESLANLGVE